MDESMAMIVQHAGGHQYSKWETRRGAAGALRARQAPAVVRKFGEVRWAILVPDEVAKRDVHHHRDWAKITPETPGVVVLLQSPVEAV